ncbi:hypothetical protein PCASD_07292 [Puccinia coronata f. sp. avenae]|uniref:Uncharacterized protein n=1 Tax=Puccinia coronata f. sp. avenae TaxID=200324 RepID=A0A2N5T083_9BASI|nr:hypothetical protein PCASD_16816 [Puccinia coronata f. sp. avenae]PLW40338.1 hypothetical protein PCASD_07292 [Puccinia coronata f. sp. avenae]
MTSQTPTHHGQTQSGLGSMAKPHQALVTLAWSTQPHRPKQQRYTCSLNLDNAQIPRTAARTQIPHILTSSDPAANCTSNPQIMYRCPWAIRTTGVFAIGSKKHYLKQCFHTGRGLYEYEGLMYSTCNDNSPSKPIPVSLRAYSFDNDGLAKDHLHLIPGNWITSAKRSPVPIYQFLARRASVLGMTVGRNWDAQPRATVHTCGIVAKIVDKGNPRDEDACTLVMRYKDYDMKLAVEGDVTGFDEATGRLIIKAHLVCHSNDTPVEAKDDNDAEAKGNDEA